MFTRRPRPLTPKSSTSPGTARAPFSGGKRIRKTCKPRGSLSANKANENLPSKIPELARQYAAGHDLCDWSDRFPAGCLPHIGSKSERLECPLSIVEFRHPDCRGGHRRSPGSSEFIRPNQRQHSRRRMDRLGGG